VRLGIIGVGRIGASHARTLAQFDEVEALLIADASAERAASVAASTGGTAVGSAGEVISAGVDGIVIAASTDEHGSLLRAAVDAGIPAFCEKPIAGSAAESASIAAYVSARDVPVQIGYPRRFDPGFAAARRAVRAGELGELVAIRSTTLDPSPPPAAYLATSGRIFHDCGVHDFDSVRWVTGQEVVEVFATGSPFADPAYADLDDCRTAAAVLTLESGALAVVSLSRYNGRGYDVRLEVHGTKDAVAAGLDDRLPLRSAEPGIEYPRGPAASFFLDRLAEAFRRELAAFLEVVAGRAPSPCTVGDALRTSLVAEACTQSWRENRPVRIT
jgi:myo-inositol 2-dehydrogenase/D-chiro-inositol 1-dehydrogenase